MASGSEITQHSDATVLSRSQRMAAALTSYARNLTFENRSRRNLYKLADIAPKLRDKVFSYLMVTAFVFYFAAPMTLSIVYFVGIASPQYESQVRFVVRSAVPLLTRDRYSSGNAEPKAKIVQDTAVILNYLTSPAIVKDFSEEIDIDHLYGRLSIDRFSRLKSDATHEEILDYWEGQLSSGVNPKSGIVELKVRAFSGEEAHQALLLVVKLAEKRVNELNGAMWENLTFSAQKDLDAATAELEALRIQMRDTQNETGVFDVNLSAESLINILTSARTELSELETKKEALSSTLSNDSPLVAFLDKQIFALKSQVQSLERQVTGNDPAAEGNLANFSKMFEKIKLDISLAESRLESAVSELEKAKLVGSLQLVYIDPFTDPTLPAESSYPRVWLTLLICFLVFSTLWGGAAGILMYIRKIMD